MVKQKFYVYWWYNICHLLKFFEKIYYVRVNRRNPHERIKLLPQYIDYFVVELIIIIITIFCTLFHSIS